MAPRLARARRLRLRAGRRVVGGMGGPRTHTAACPRHRAASARSHGCQPGGCARSRGWHAFARRTGRGPRHAPGVAAGWRLAARRGGPARWRGVARPCEGGRGLAGSLAELPGTDACPYRTARGRAGGHYLAAAGVAGPVGGGASRRPCRPVCLVHASAAATHHAVACGQQSVGAGSRRRPRRGVHHHPAGVGPGGGAPGRRAARGHAYRGAAARRRTGPGAGSGFRSAVGPRGRRSAGPAGHAARRRARAAVPVLYGDRLDAPAGALPGDSEAAMP
ncbi:secretory protein [Bordetella pertussis]|nr:secretory protein [Bordetella pertussis]